MATSSLGLPISGRKSNALFDVLKGFDLGERKSIIIVILGKSGVGKSRLVNSLIGKENAAKEGNTLSSGTRKPSDYKLRQEGIEIILWDTPGLDGTDEKVKQLLKSTAKAVGSTVDLLLWCVCMNTRSLDGNDRLIIKSISRVFGSHILNKTMVALTFANEVEPRYEESTVEEFFINRMQQFVENYSRLCRVDSNSPAELPTVAVGDFGKFGLPNCENWLICFWDKALSCILKEAPKPSLHDCGTNTPTHQLSEAFQFVRDHLAAHEEYNDYISLLNIFEKFINEGRKSITFVLVGKTGSGKSRLVNALIGRHVATEGHKLVAETTKVLRYKTTTKEGISITVWDTPGLEDGSSREGQYLTSIARTVKQVDLLVFCAAMNDRRIRTEDETTIKRITEAFGTEIWRNGMIALTFANVLRPPSEQTNDEEAFFQRRLGDFEEEYHKFLVRANSVIPVPVVPAGDIGVPKLPNCKDWLPQFWLCAFQRTARSAKPAMLQINYSRLRLDSEQHRENEGKDSRNGCSLRHHLNETLYIAFKLLKKSRL